jgi:two-component system cell cycle response regulator
MRAALRAGDSIYRVGGEEILVMLPGAGYAEAIEIAERLRGEVKERRPVGVAVSLSIGVAVAERGPVDTDDMLARADAALYAAKAEGRDRVFTDSAAEVDVAVEAGAEGGEQRDRRLHVS